jgi:hypothetical protein
MSHHSSYYFIFAINSLKQAVRKLYLVFSFFLLVSASAFGQFEQAVAHTKVIFIYNFTKFVEWPPDYRQGDFVIGVMNANPVLLSELNKLASQKTSGNQKFIIKNFKSVDEIDKCNILYIPDGSNNLLTEALKKLHGTSTLLITESEGDAKKGSAINFIWKDSKQAFELNKSNAEKNHLIVSSSLKTLAAVNIE